MVKTAVIVFIGSLIVMHVTWRLGIRRALVHGGLPVHGGTGSGPLQFSMIRDALALLRHARGAKIWPFSLKLFMVASFFAAASLVVPIGRLILSNQHYIPAGGSP